MKINKKTENGCIVLVFEGWLDVETTPELAKYMEGLEMSENLVFDFGKLEYISSSGVREVVSAYRRQKEAGGHFEIIHVNDEIMDVFSMTGIDRKIKISGK